MDTTIKGTVLKGNMVAYQEVKIHFFTEPLEEPWSGFVQVLSWEPQAPELFDQFELVLEDGRELSGYVVTRNPLETTVPIRFTLSGSLPGL